MSARNLAAVTICENVNNQLAQDSEFSDIFRIIQITCNINSSNPPLLQTESEGKSRKSSLEESETKAQSSTKETNIISNRQVFQLKKPLLDPFQDQWKTVNLSEKITIYLYSAFLDEREKNSGPVIRILAAKETKHTVRLQSWYITDKLRFVGHLRHICF